MSGFLTDGRRLRNAAILATAAFLLLWIPQEQGWFEPINDAVDAAVVDGLRHTDLRTVTCTAGQGERAPTNSTFVQCSYLDGGMTRIDERSYRKGAWNGTWNETHTMRESVLPWAGIPLELGGDGGALGIAVATPLLLLFLRQRRSAFIAVVTAALGGALVDPLKYGWKYGWSWSPYPSGHTIGATLMWGLLLTFVVVALMRTSRLTSGGRWPLVAWASIALLVGIDLIHMRYHPISDILLGWSFSAALVFAALWLDNRLRIRQDLSAAITRDVATPGGP